MEKKYQAMTMWLEDMVRTLFSQSMVDSAKTVRDQLINASSLHVNEDPSPLKPIELPQPQVEAQVPDTSSVTGTLGSIVDSGVSTFKNSTSIETGSTYHDNMENKAQEVNFKDFDISKEKIPKSKIEVEIRNQVIQMIFNESLDHEFLKTWNLPNNYVDLLDYLLKSSGFGDLISSKAINLDEGADLDSNGNYVNSEDFCDQMIFLNCTDSVG